MLHSLTHSSRASLSPSLYLCLSHLVEMNCPRPFRPVEGVVNSSSPRDSIVGREKSECRKDKKIIITEEGIHSPNSSGTKLMDLGRKGPLLQRPHRTSVRSTADSCHSVGAFARASKRWAIEPPPPPPSPQPPTRRSYGGGKTTTSTVSNGLARLIEMTDRAIGAVSLQQHPTGAALPSAPPVPSTANLSLSLSPLRGGVGAKQLLAGARLQASPVVSRRLSSHSGRRRRRPHDGLDAKQVASSYCRGYSSGSDFSEAVGGNLAVPAGAAVCYGNNHHHPGQRKERDDEKGAPQPNQDDQLLFLGLPVHLGPAILIFLEPFAVLRVSRVSKAFHVASASPALWHYFCRNQGFSLSPDCEAHSFDIDALQTRSSRAGTNLWKEMWIEGWTTRSNWDNGICTIQDFAVANRKDSVTCLRSDADKIVVGTRSHHLSIFPPIYTLPVDPTSGARSSQFRPTCSLDATVHHAGGITSTDFSPSAPNLCATGDKFGTVLVWNLFSGRVVARLEYAHPGGITAILVAACTRAPLHVADSGRSEVMATILTAGFDKLIRVHELRNIDRPAPSVSREQSARKDTRFRLPMRSSSAQSASPGTIASVLPIFDKIGKRAKSALELSLRHAKIADKGMLRKSIEIVTKAKWKGHFGDIYCMDFLPVDDKVVSGSLDHTVKVWDRSTGDCEQTFHGHSDAVTCLCWKDGVVYSGSLDRTVRAWSVRTGKAGIAFVGNSSWIKAIGVTSRFLVSGGWDEIVKVWNLGTGQALHHFCLSRGPIVALQAGERSIIASCRGEGFQHQITVMDFGAIRVADGPKRGSFHQSAPQAPLIAQASPSSESKPSQTRADEREAPQASSDPSESAQTLLMVPAQSPPSSSDEVVDATEYLACTEGYGLSESCGEYFSDDDDDGDDQFEGDVASLGEELDSIESLDDAAFSAV
ncbi:WD40-repeat-containing domain protein [Zopfochytrium polystomum]|nr:WD40-repeat-containing domain protein [Zopfochytrium polystomum]